MMNRHLKINGAKTILWINLLLIIIPYCYGNHNLEVKIENPTCNEPDVLLISASVPQQLSDTVVFDLVII